MTRTGHRNVDCSSGPLPVVQAARDAGQQACPDERAVPATPPRSREPARPSPASPPGLAGRACGSRGTPRWREPPRSSTEDSGTVALFVHDEARADVPAFSWRCRPPRWCLPMATESAGRPKRVNTGPQSFPQGKDGRFRLCSSPGRVATRTPGGSLLRPTADRANHPGSVAVRGVIPQTRVVWCSESAHVQGVVATGGIHVGTPLGRSVGTTGGSVGTTPSSCGTVHSAVRVVRLPATSVALAEIV